MRRRLFPIVILTIIFIICGQREFNVRAEHYREDLILPPHEIYRNILRYAGEKDYKKVEKALGMIGGIITALDKKYSTDIGRGLKDSIDKNDEGMISRLIYKLIYLDIFDLMEHSVREVENSTDKAKSKLRMAYLNYLILSPLVERKDFASDVKIKKMFRDATRLIERSTPYGKDESIRISSNELQGITEKIAKQCELVLLGF